MRQVEKDCESIVLPSMALVATSTRLDQSSEAVESGTGTLVLDDGLDEVSALARGDNLQIVICT